jgi:hypothetical protein
MGELREAGVTEMLDGEIAVPAPKVAAEATLLSEYQSNKDEDPSVRYAARTNFY